MRLSWSLAFNRSADFLFRSGAFSKESSSALSSLPLERKKTFSSLSQEIKKDGIKPVIFYLPWMRLTGLRTFFSEAVHLPKKAPPPSARSRSNAKRRSHCYSQQIRQDNKSHPVLFTLDAIVLVARV